jgi:hypothetical protein
VLFRVKGKGRWGSMQEVPKIGDRVRFWPRDTGRESVMTVEEVYSFDDGVVSSIVYSVSGRDDDGMLHINYEVFAIEPLEGVNHG